MTQPAVSRYIRELEAALAVELFARPPPLGGADRRGRDALRGGERGVCADSSRGEAAPAPEPRSRDVAGLGGVCAVLDCPAAVGAARQALGRPAGPGLRPGCRGTGRRLGDCGAPRRRGVGGIRVQAARARGGVCGGEPGLCARACGFGGCRLARRCDAHPRRGAVPGVGELGGVLRGWTTPTTARGCG